MGLNIKNEEVERLVAEVARLTGETKTEVVRQALLERQHRLGLRTQQERTRKAFEYLEQEVWPRLTEDQRRTRTKAEIEELLGYGPDGV